MKKELLSVYTNFFVCDCSFVRAMKINILILNYIGCYVPLFVSSDLLVANFTTKIAPSIKTV